MAFADSGLRPKCPKCHTNHWPKDPCVSSKYDPLCQLCHHWHSPSIFCNPFDVPPKPEGTQEKKDQAAVDWQAEGEQIEWEAKHRHKGKK